MTYHYIISNYLKASKTFEVYAAIFEKMNKNQSYQGVEIKTQDRSKVNSEELKKIEHFLQDFRQDRNSASIVISNPFKQSMFQYCDQIEGQAVQMETINLITKKDGILVGENIDGDAFFMGQQKTKNFDFIKKTVLLLGCGGVSTAVSFKLAQKNVQKLVLFDLDRKRSVSLKEKLHRFFPTIELDIVQFVDDIQQIKPDYIYNGTGIGKTSDNPHSLTETPLGDIPKNTICIDANYTPWETKFLQIASDNGCTTLNGFSHMVAFTTLHVQKILQKEIVFEDVYRIGMEVLTPMPS